ncbi:MAG: SUMF1/EgtB/PvdO family nonheme iron enzyme, partial [bacterium]
MKRYALLIGVEEYRDKMISRLNFARADARALAHRLRDRCAFDNVRVLADESGDDEPLLLNIVGALSDIASELQPEDLFLFFFAGHGVEKGGHGYLLARDSMQAFPEHGSLSLELLRKTFESFVARQRILLLDACRNSPDAGRSGADNRMGDAISRDIVAAARTKPTTGQTTVLFSACRAGQRAYEWPGKRQGVFTHYLLDGLDGAAWTDTGLEFARLAQHTTKNVRRWSAQTPGLPDPQEPWYEQFGEPGPVLLASGGRTTPPEEPPPGPSAQPKPPYERAKEQRPEGGGPDVEALVTKLEGARKYYKPNSTKVRQAEQALRRVMLEELAPRVDALKNQRGELSAEMLPAHPKMVELARLIKAEHVKLRTAAEMLGPALTEGDRQALYGIVLPEVYAEWPFNVEEARRRQEETAAVLVVPVEKTVKLGGGVTMDLVLIPAGEFMMGSPRAEDERYDNETQHEVRITKPFYMSKTEVTQEQWERMMGENPADFKGAKNPVDSVSWNDCRDFAKKLSEQVDSLTFSLPTEAEWEYACRAGSTTKYCFGDSDRELGNYAWYRPNSDGKTHPVGQKKPNAFGLYDMHGNLWEWCQDRYGADYYKN